MLFTVFLPVSRYNNTLPLNRLQEGEGGFYTFYALNNVTNGSVTFSISLKCKCLSVLSPCLPLGLLRSWKKCWLGYLAASSSAPTGHTDLAQTCLCITQGSPLVYCCMHGKETRAWGMCSFSGHSIHCLCDFPNSFSKGLQNQGASR